MKNLLKDLTFPKEINLLFLSVLLFAITMGINFVIFPATLTLKGFLAHNIGIFFAFDTLGCIVMSLILSKIVAQLHVLQTIKISAIAYCLIVAAIYFCQSFYLWLAFSFTLGAFWFMYVITRQAWFNILLNSKKRGIASAIFTMAIAFGIFLGPVIVKFSGATNYASFLISSLLVAASLLCLYPLRNAPKPEITPEKIKLTTFFKDNPKIFLARFFIDFQTFVILTLTVSFGIHNGLSAETAGLLISAFMISCVLDIFIGVAITKLNPQKIINFGFIVSLACFISIALFKQYYLALLVSYFILGIAGGCIFITTLNVNNENYSKDKLVAANATFQLIGSLGSISGALISACLINFIGILGFLITITASPIIYLSFILFYDKKNH